MALTPHNRMRIKRALGYPLISAVETLRSGILPSGPDDLVFALEPALSNIIPEAEQAILEIVRQIECIEEQQANQRADLAVLAVGSVQLAGRDGMGALDDEYRKWVAKLSDTLAIPVYRHSRYQREIGAFAGRVIEQC